MALQYMPGGYMTIAAIAEVLGGKKVLRKEIETSSELAKATRAGLSGASSIRFSAPRLA